MRARGDDSSLQRHDSSLRAKRSNPVCLSGPGLLRRLRLLAMTRGKSPSRSIAYSRTKKLIPGACGRLIFPPVLLDRGRHLEASNDGAGCGARGRETNAPPRLSSGDGAPPGDTMTPRREPADDAEPSGSFGSAARRCKTPQWSAGRRAFAFTSGSDAPRKRVTDGFAGHPRSVIASAPRFPALRSPRRGRRLAAPKPQGRGA